MVVARGQGGGLQGATVQYLWRFGFAIWRVPEVDSGDGGATV